MARRKVRRVEQAGVPPIVGDSSDMSGPLPTVGQPDLPPVPDATVPVGSPAGFDLGFQPPPGPQPAEMLDAAHSRIEIIKTAVESQIQQCLATVGLAVHEIGRCVRNAANDAIGQAVGVLSAVHSEVETGAAADLGKVLELTATLGIQPPGMGEALPGGTKLAVSSASGLGDRVPSPQSTSLLAPTGGNEPCPPPGELIDPPATYPSEMCGECAHGLVCHEGTGGPEHVVCEPCWTRRDSSVIYDPRCGPCCFSDGHCEDIAEEECTFRKGRYFGGLGNCADVPQFELDQCKCPTPVPTPIECIGACCLPVQPDYVCGYGPNACSIGLRNYPCRPDTPCPPLPSIGVAVCCPNPNAGQPGGCFESTESVCEAFGGVWYGCDSKCSTPEVPDICSTTPPPKKRSACCRPDGTCYSVTDCTYCNGPGEICHAGKSCGDVTCYIQPTPTPPPIPVPIPVPLPTPDRCPPPSVTCPSPVVNCPKPPEPPSDMWRVWQRCGGEYCIITGPWEGPKNVDDLLIGEFKKAAEASAFAAESCKQCEEVPPGPPPQDTGDPLNWDKLSVCEDADKIEFDIIGNPADWFARMLAVDGADGKGRTPEWLWAILKALKWANAPFKGVFKSIFDRFVEIMQAVAKPCPEPSAQVIQLDTVRLLLHTLAGITGPTIADYARPYDHLRHYHCPTEIPSTDEAIRAFLADEISEDLLKCWTKANGCLWTPKQKIVRADRTKVDARSILALWRRGKLEEDEVKPRLRQLGYILDTDSEELKELTNLIPPYTDLIRMMVRDVVDDDVVGPEALDTDFENKFKGKIQEWADAQGIGEDVARFLWRSHWQYPSAGQLYEILHRVPADDPVWQGREPINEIRRLLRVNDMAPRWNDALIAVAYRPLSRIDARRAYAIGSIDDDRLGRAFLDLGYDKPTSDVLVRFFSQLRVESLQNDYWIKQYKTGGTGSGVVEEKLTTKGLPAETVTMALAEAKSRMLAETTKRCTTAMRRQFLTGALTKGQAIVALAEQGLDGDQSEIIVHGWQCEATARGRTAPLATLCKWHERGAIDDAEFLRRLTTLGWTPADARRLIDDCNIRITKDRERAEEKRLKQEEARIRREDKERKAAERDIERERAARDRKAAQARKLLERREDDRLKAASNVAKKCQIDVCESASWVRDAIAKLQSEQGRSLDEAIKAAMLASTRVSLCTREGYVADVESAACAESESGGNGESVTVP